MPDSMSYMLSYTVSTGHGWRSRENFKRPME